MNSAIPATSSGDGMKPHRQISPLSLYRYCTTAGTPRTARGRMAGDIDCRIHGALRRLRPQRGHRPQAGQPLRYVSASMIIPQQGVSMKAMGRSPRIAGGARDGHRPWVSCDPVPSSRTDAPESLRTRRKAPRPNLVLPRTRMRRRVGRRTRRPKTPVDDRNPLHRSNLLGFRTSATPPLIRPDGPQN